MQVSDNLIIGDVQTKWDQASSSFFFIAISLEKYSFLSK